MAQTLIVLDEQCIGKTFPFGTTSSGGNALVTVNVGTASTTTVVLDVKGSQNIVGDLNLTGNLNITGSINEQSVTNLQVTDKTITINNGGSTPADDTAGLVVQGTSSTTIGALYYRATSATKWSIGDGSSQQDLVGTTATQTLTNKSISGGQITSAVANATMAASTTLVAVTDDTTTNATMYPIWVTTTSGNQAQKVSSTKMTFNPSTGVLTSTSFTGAGTGLTGTASGLTAGAVTTNANLTGDVTSVGNTTTLAKYFRAVTVSGTQDSVNKIFTIASAVMSGSEQVFRNGQLLTPGASNDYVISGTTITFQAADPAPAATSVLRIYGVY